MNKTDKNIHKVLVDNELNYTIDSELENNIMDAIGEQKDYKTLLLKAKHKVKIGLIVSMVLLILYIVITYFELFTSNSYSQLSLKSFYPSIFTAIVVVVVYFEMTLGIFVLKKPSKYN